MKRTLTLAALLAAPFALAPYTFADDHQESQVSASQGRAPQENKGHQGHSHSEHSNSSVAGHVHEAGEWMFTYRHMSMSMSGNLQGSDSISDDEMATSVTNRFAGMPGMPPTLRIVPQDMENSMDMLGVMYGFNSRFTVMAMLNYIRKDMELLTYQGGMGTTELGAFSTESSGFGDLKLAGLWSLIAGENSVVLNVGLSLPTGSVDEEGAILSPMNMRPEVRLPYSMQLGSGSYGFEPGLRYSGIAAKWSWDVELQARIYLNDNAEDYRLGNEESLSGELSYQFTPVFSASAGLQASHRGSIDGIDKNIMGPVHTADPDNYGGRFVDFNAGFTAEPVSGHEFDFEYSLPIKQNVNGVQMEMDSMWSMAYRITI
ncbi:MAG: hypothetical protein ACI93R_001356 [Flavobacteriales bacterium]|jgi:hypothetical protein